MPFAFTWQLLALITHFHAQMKHIVAAISLLSALVGLFVWTTGIPDVKTLLFGPDEVQKQDKRLAEELERELATGRKVTKNCSLGALFCARGSLVDQDNQVVEFSNDRTVRVISFGSILSHCKHVAENVDILTRSIGAIIPIKGYYVGLDSRFDTIANLRNFKRELNFTINLLTGSDAQLKEVANSLRVFYSAGFREDGSAFFDHTRLIFVLDADGNVIAYVHSDTDLQRAAVLMLKAIIAANRSDPAFIKTASTVGQSSDQSVAISRAEVLRALTESDFAGLRSHARDLERSRRMKPCS